MKKAGILSIILIIAVLGAAGFVSWKAYKEARRNRQIEKEIETLRQEAQKIRQSNDSLREKIAYFETQDFQEREAKEKLNFQKSGENVAVVKPTVIGEEANESNASGENQAFQESARVPNYKKWWDKFFKVIE